VAIPGNLLSSTTETIDPNTSGWMAALNCKIGKGSGGRAGGDGCLGVTSIAAGEMQARTVASYPVTPGTLYQAFADTSGAVPERIGIRWLSATGAEVGVTWSLTTTTATSSWHRVGVAGYAPATADRAQVLLSSTETAANAVHYWENIFFGLPIRTQGNLLPWTTESAEVDTAGWTAVANATVSRQTPISTWPVTNWVAGGHMLAMTAVAAGNASVATVDRPPVTPGVEYLAYAYLQPPTSASTAWIELRFYDSGGSQIAAQRSTLAAPATGFYRQRVSLVAPAGAATCALAAGLDGATAGQVLRLDNVVIAVCPPVVAGTLLDYASSSFEQGTGGWTVASGPSTIARSSPWGAGLEGSYALTLTAATASTTTIRSPHFPGVTPGRNYRTQLNVFVAAGTWSTMATAVHWYDAAGVSLGASVSTTFPVPTGGWYSLRVDSVAPAGAARAAVEVTPTASAASSVLRIDGVALWEALPLTVAEAVADRGYVKLTLRELTLGESLTIYRVTEDGARTLVRGPAGLIERVPVTSDLMITEDHEVPFGVPVMYRIERYSSSGTLVATRLSDQVTLTLVDHNEVWLKDPGNPQRNMRALVAAAPEWQRPIDQSAMVVRGRRNKVVLSGRRNGLEGELRIWTRSDDERKSLHLLLDSGATLLWQAAAGMGVQDMYVNVGQVSEGRVSPLAQEPWREWTLPLTEADLPAAVGVTSSAGQTWQDVLSQSTTWDAVLAAYPTWEAVLLAQRTE
jgi:hypothetical protein